MRVVYAIFNHRPAPQLVRLVNALGPDGDAIQVVVHHDGSRAALDTTPFRRATGVTLLSSERPISMGDGSLMDAYWRLFSWVSEHLALDWLVVLSGQDYPTRPWSELEALLATAPVDAFLEAEPVLTWPNSREQRDRYFRYHYRYSRPLMLASRHLLPVRVRRHVRRATRPGAALFNLAQRRAHLYEMPDLGPYVIGRYARHGYPPDLPVWSGSCWMTLRRTTVEVLLAYAKAHPTVVQHFRQTVMPEEAAIATIICNDPSQRVVHHGLHYIKWSGRRREHPEVLTSADLAAILSSGAYFARKFDAAVDESILDSLDRHVAGIRDTSLDGAHRLP